MSDRLRPPPHPDTVHDPNIPTAVPVDDAGESLIPELRGRAPTRTEQSLISGDWINVGSTNVDRFRWEFRGGGILTVQFLDGSIYDYFDVPLTVAAAFVASDSAGRFVWNVLRGEGYRFRLVSKGAGARKPTRVIRIHR
jgi:hypothetical protein